MYLYELTETQEAILDIFSRYNFASNYVVLILITIFTILAIRNKINKLYSLFISCLLISILISDLSIIVAFSEWIGWYFNGKELNTMLTNYNFKYNVIFIISLICISIQILIIIKEKFINFKEKE